MKSSAETVEQYLEEWHRSGVKPSPQSVTSSSPTSRRGTRRGWISGMIAYVVPLARYPKTYNGHPLSYAGISSEKNHVSSTSRTSMQTPKASGGSSTTQGHREEAGYGQVVCAVQEARRSAVEPDRKGGQPVPDGRVDSVLRILASSQEVCWIETGTRHDLVPQTPLAGHDIQDPALAGVLTPYTTDEMEAYEASSLVNSPANDGAELVVPVRGAGPG